MHLLQLGKHFPGVAQQGFAGPGQGHAPGLAGKQGRAQGVLQLTDAVAGGGGRQMGLLGTPGEVALLRHGQEQFQVDKIVAHGRFRL